MKKEDPIKSAIPYVIIVILLVGWKIDSGEFEQKAIDHGCMEYNQKTGEKEWK